MSQTNKYQKSPLNNVQLEQWFVNRRNFIKAGLIAGTLTQVSFLQSCFGNQTKNYPKGNQFITDEQTAILYECLNILFPNDGNGPGIDEINTISYILWSLEDPGSDKYFNKYLVEGVDWANEKAIEKIGSPFLELSDEQKEKSIAYFIQDNYGKEWCSIMMTFIIESLLIDPIYGCNSNESGWKWLNFTAGIPRPTEFNRYENILINARKDYPKNNHEI